MSLTSIACFAVGIVLVIVSSLQITFSKNQASNRQVQRILVGILGLATMAIGFVLATNS